MLAGSVDPAPSPAADLLADRAICHTRRMSDFETPDELRPWSIVDKATLALVIISGVTWLVQAGLFLW